MDNYDTYRMLYDLISIVVILTTLICFLVTFNTVFPHGGKLLLKFKLGEVKRGFENRPIRGGLTAISFLIFFSMIATYIVPVEIDGWFIIRTIFLRIPVLAASLIILWTVVHIQHGDWDINRRYDEEEKRRR